MMGGNRFRTQLRIQGECDGPVVGLSRTHGAAMGLERKIAFWSFLAAPPGTRRPPRRIFGTSPLAGIGLLENHRNWRLTAGRFSSTFWVWGAEPLAHTR